MTTSGMPGRVARECRECLRTFIPQGSRSKGFCSILCARRFWGRRHRGANHPRYKGKVQAADGYIRIYKPGHPLASADGYVLEHRLVIYEAGIEVPAGYRIHHRNHDRADNRLENLVVLSAREHTWTHYTVGFRNQYGFWPRVDEETQKKRKKQRMQEWRRNHQEHIKAYRQQRKAEGKVY